MLDEHAKEGYTEVIPPYIVKSKSMYGTGQFLNLRTKYIKLMGRYDFNSNS